MDVGGLIRLWLVDDVERPTGMEGVKQTSSVVESVMSGPAQELDRGIRGRGA